LNEEIHSLEHENKNLLIQLQLLQNHLTSDDSSNETKMKDTVQFNSARHLPEVYRRAFERQSLAYHMNDEKQDESIELNHEHEEKIFDEVIQELNTLSLDQKDLFDLIGRTITKMNLHLNGSKKLVRE
jgi:DNA-binding ferritin-like protein (Dps family)